MYKLKVGDKVVAVDNNEQKGEVIDLFNYGYLVAWDKDPTNPRWHASHRLKSYTEMSTELYARVRLELYARARLDELLSCNARISKDEV